MRKFLPLLLCLSLSIFTVARATKPAQAAPEQRRSKRTEGRTDAKALVNDANTEEEQVPTMTTARLALPTMTAKT